MRELPDGSEPRQTVLVLPVPGGCRDRLGTVLFTGAGSKPSQGLDGNSVSVTVC